MIPTTRLPVIKDGLVDGIVASTTDSRLQELFDDLVVSNPEIASFVGFVDKHAGNEAAKCCLLMYKLLETQAECDEL